ncbi:DUF5988 family protein [Streptomyces sp. Je 1-4]|uniref:DUF5988 family protein n=1 Tax=Streptomyces TaxID=1883 RepID=UPI002180C219|nr:MULTISPECIES: DUF5988 family protein [unclassified Streptomyces]UYB42369.1 DUF5988 family protein [Streptomyces sp. Je 1-4]UZQ38669.1 DUF5988 family protein [Streptomyces sp. Je 1-4] [Streptomyces sp. Je 1-4 4N24]UZQ46086.1 DUF5988 family protein [Streptomyces sp. Je 1-4] [Streptomyces sp. Je 1-4 4N24_ara]
MAKRRMVILVDGPEGNALPQHLHDDAGDPIRLLRGNGYERFEFYGEYADLGGQQVPVYRWCYRTRIAE